MPTERRLFKKNPFIISNNNLKQLHNKTNSLSWRINQSIGVSDGRSQFDVCQSVQSVILFWCKLKSALLVCLQISDWSIMKGRLVDWWGGWHGMSGWRRARASSYFFEKEDKEQEEKQEKWMRKEWSTLIKINIYFKYWKRFQGSNVQGQWLVAIFRIYYIILLQAY